MPTFKLMKGYLQNSVLLQSEDDNPSHLKYGHELSGKMTYDGNGKIDNTVVSYKTCSFRITMIPPADISPEERIISVVIKNGTIKNALFMDNVEWNSNVVSYLSINENKTGARNITCYVTTKSGPKLADIKIYSYTRSTVKDHIAGKNYNLKADNFELE